MRWPLGIRNLFPATPHTTPHSGPLEENGSPEDTDLERISLAGPRIRYLDAVVRDREWCPVAITNSLCVNRVRVSRWVNTAENPG